MIKRPRDERGQFKWVPRVELTCKSCGKTFLVPRYKVGKQKYCSRQCIRRTFWVDEETLRSLYWDKGLSLKRIGERFSVTGTTVSRWMKKYGIPRRTTSEMTKNAWSIPGIRQKYDGQGYNFLDENHEPWNKGKEWPEAAEKFEDPDFLSRFIRGRFDRPTKPEKKVLTIIKANNFPYKYVGDGKVIIGRLNPDFIHHWDNKVIEVFGRAYHDPNKTFRDEIPWYQTYQGRIKALKSCDYDCLILWDDELDDEKEVILKIRRFGND